MKRLFTHLALMACLAITIIGCGGNQNENGKSLYTDAIPEDALVVCYLDANQIVEKSDLSAELQVALNMLAAENGDQTVKELLNAKFGVDTEQPIYAFMQFFSEEEFAGAVVAPVKDVEKVKQTIDYIGNEVSDIEQKTEGGNTVVQIEEAYIGYNDNTVILAACKDCNGYETVFGYLEESQSGKNKTLPNIDSYDMAIYMEFDNIIDMLQTTGAAYDDDVAGAMEILKQYKESTAILGLAFEQGRVTLDCTIDNMPQELMNNNCSAPCNNNFLNNVSKNSLAVMNLNINGPLVVEQLAKLPDTYYQNMQEQMGVDAEELQSIVGMISEYLATLNGDITIALEDINIDAEQLFAYGMAETTNSDIFDLVIGNLGEQGEQITNNKYCFDINIGSPLYIGQEGSMLYASIPNAPSYKPSNAQDAVWFNDVKGYPAYLVVNAQAVLNNPSIKREINDEMYSLSYSERKLVDKILKLPSYAFLRGNNNTMTISIVLQDKNTNALAQVANIVKSFAMQNLN